MAEGNGGRGTASRQVNSPGGRYVVGVLVQANYGFGHLLRVDGVPVDKEIGSEQVPLPGAESPQGGSIIVIIATDAPLLPIAPSWRHLQFASCLS